MTEGTEVELRGLTIQDGHTAFSGGGIEIRNAVTAKLTDVTVRSNRAESSGGGIVVRQSAKLAVMGSEVSNNTAAREGGGIHVTQLNTVTIEDSAIEDNIAEISEEQRGGGGISSRGTLEITRSRVRGNRAEWGGGILSQGPDPDDALVSHLTIRGSVLDENAAAVAGGAIASLDYSDVTLTNVTIADSVSQRHGGGVFIDEKATASLENVTVSGNEAAEDGGAIYIVDGSSATFTNSTVSGNRAIEGAGGGLWAGGQTALTHTTIADNLAPTGSAVNVRGALSLSGTLVQGDCILESGAAVISLGGNLESPGDTCGLSDASDQVGVIDPMIAPLSSKDWAVAARELAAAQETRSEAEMVWQELEHVANTAEVVYLAAVESGAPQDEIDQLWQALLAAEEQAQSAFEELAAALESEDAAEDRAEAARLIGPPLVHALLPGSPAIDAVPEANCPPPFADQRGVSRPQGVACDVGAYEHRPELLYGVNSGEDRLSIIDPATGVSTTVGPLDPDPGRVLTPVAMAVRPSDRQIFVWNNDSPDRALLAVDRCTGLGTQVEPTTPPQRVVQALAFGPQDALLGLGLRLDVVDGALLAIDATSGEVTQISTLPGLPAGADFAAGYLYALRSTGAGIQEIIRIDPESGALTEIARLTEDVGTVGSMVFDEFGNLLGSGRGGPYGDILFDLDPGDGSVSNIRSVSGGSAPQGLGFAPACPSGDVITGVIEGNLDGDGGDFAISAGTLIDGNVANVGSLTILAGPGGPIEIAGNLGASTSIIVEPGAELILGKNVIIANLRTGAGGRVTVEKNLEVTGALVLDAGATLVVQGSLFCSPVATAELADSSELSIVGQLNCPAVP
jgi:predicted outer membrane repeat protein